MIINFKYSLYRIKSFLAFSAISGLGWLIDFTIFTLLVLILNIQTYTANFITSYIGITFVWFVSLGAVFQSKKNPLSIYIIIYWCFQFISILFFSKIIQEIAAVLQHLIYFSESHKSVNIISKILVTPINLVTNFIFMQQLVKFLKSKDE